MKITIQEGLQQEVIIGRYTSYSVLTSEEGYCFYDKNQEITDEEGNLLPSEEIKPEQRQYMRYCATPMTSMDEINETYISVPIEPNFEIV
jgi:hypothetical protein